jgi:hypothetical protein
VESLRQLVHSALTADLIIVAAQQRMLPKLVASYCHAGAPLVIVLYRNRIPDNSDVVNRHEQRFLYVNIESPDLDRVVARIEQAVAERMPSAVR